MSGKKIGIAVVLADFAALTAYALYVHGFAEFFELALANWATVTVLADLVIALGLVTVWVWTDARDRGISPLPYVALTLGLGSIGPLAYLLLRPDREREGDVVAAAATSRA